MERGEGPGVVGLASCEEGAWAWRGPQRARLTFAGVAFGFSTIEFPTIEAAGTAFDVIETAETASICIGTAKANASAGTACASCASCFPIQPRTTIKATQMPMQRQSTPPMISKIIMFMPLSAEATLCNVGAGVGTSVGRGVGAGMGASLGL